MKLFRAVGSVLLFSRLLLVDAADECQPATWVPAGARVADAGTTTFAPLQTFAAAPNGSAIQPGEVNCRNWGYTYASVNYYTCTALADKWHIDVALFFRLNPILQPDCSNVRINTKYCVAGCQLLPLISMSSRLETNMLTNGAAPAIP